MEDTTIEWGQQRTIFSFTDTECIHHFCFRQQHLKHLSDLLWPRLQLHLEGTATRIICQNKYVCTYKTGFSILLYQLAQLVCIRPNMEKVFGLWLAHLSSIISTFCVAFYWMSLPYLSNPNLFLDRIPYYASLVRTKSEMAIDKVWGFIDGKLRKTCRPTHFQNAAYSGHKRFHGLKF